MSFRRRRTSRMPDDDEFRPILEVAEELGLKCDVSSPRGDWYAAVCPVHDDNNASLRINAPGNYWMCYGCDKGGSVAHLWAHLTGDSLVTGIANTVRKDADALDKLGFALEEETSSLADAAVALQLMLVERYTEGEPIDLERWCRALVETDNEADLVEELRASLSGS